MYRHRKASLFTRLIRSIVGLERAEGTEAIVESRDGITPVRGSVKEGLVFLIISICWDILLGFGSSSESSDESEEDLAKEVSLLEGKGNGVIFCFTGVGETVDCLGFPLSEDEEESSSVGDGKGMIFLNTGGLSVGCKVVGTVSSRLRKGGGIKASG